MFNRALLALCAFALLASIVNVQSEDTTPDEEKIFELVLQKKIEMALGDDMTMVYKNSFIRDLLEYLKKLVDNAARNCTLTLVKRCKKAPEFLKCASRFIKEDKGRCARP